MGARAVAARLNDFSVWELRDAVELLGDMGEADWAHPGAIAALLDDVDVVQIAAVDALGRMGAAGSGLKHSRISGVLGVMLGVILGVMLGVPLTCWSCSCFAC